MVNQTHAEPVMRKTFSNYDVIMGDHHISSKLYAHAQNMFVVLSSCQPVLHKEWFTITWHRTKKLLTLRGELPWGPLQSICIVINS